MISLLFSSAGKVFDSCGTPRFLPRRWRGRRREVGSEMVKVVLPRSALTHHVPQPLAGFGPGLPLVRQLADSWLRFLCALCVPEARPKAGFAVLSSLFAVLFSPCSLCSLWFFPLCLRPLGVLGGSFLQAPSPKPLASSLENIAHQANDKPPFRP